MKLLSSNYFNSLSPPLTNHLDSVSSSCPRRTFPLVLTEITQVSWF